MQCIHASRIHARARNLIEVWCVQLGYYNHTSDSRTGWLLQLQMSIYVSPGIYLPCRKNSFLNPEQKWANFGNTTSCLTSTQISQVTGNWRKNKQANLMSTEALLEVENCIKMALRCVEVDRAKRPTITEVVDELNMIRNPHGAPFMAILKMKPPQQHYQYRGDKWCAYLGLGNVLFRYWEKSPGPYIKRYTALFVASFRIFRTIQW
jgi:hypothetical protein